MSDLDSRIEKKKKVVFWLSLICLLLIIFRVILEACTITEFSVSGNRHYTTAQIRQIVESGWFGDNTIMVSLKYHNKSIKDIPFIETMDVTVQDRHSIRVQVYEKAMAGYVQYLDHYMYFDNDGKVVENATVATPGLPMVTGLDFDHFVMYEPLPVKDPAIFQTILDVTNMLKKHDIMTDCIYFNEKNEMTLYFEKVRVELGSSELLEEKIQQLEAMMGYLDGKSGMLDLKNYKTDSPNITFTEDR